MMMMMMMTVTEISPDSLPLVPDKPRFLSGVTVVQVSPLVAMCGETLRGTSCLIVISRGQCTFSYTISNMLYFWCLWQIIISFQVPYQRVGALYRRCSFQLDVNALWRGLSSPHLELKAIQQFGAQDSLISNGVTMVWSGLGFPATQPVWDYITFCYILWL